tara:strand:- start:231 stop:827 length:597 start_codon:yes stop_codon:yes gene_type:complete
MMGINLEEHTLFGKVSDIWSVGFRSKNGLVEFIKNVVMNMDMCDGENKNGYGVMLQDVSNLHVLVSNQDFPFESLSESQNKNINLTASEDKCFVLGYIWTSPNIKRGNAGEADFHFIEYIDSRISGLDIAKYMIDMYGDCNKACLLPYNIAYGADKYWKKYFEDEHDIETKAGLEQLIADCELNPSDIKWNSLFDILE